MSDHEPRVVVVGGYGHVGVRLARLLAPRHRVVLAGRRPAEARRAATGVGAVGAPHPVDAATGEGLDAVARPGDLVVATAGDHPGVSLLRRCIDLGCHHTDLTADRRVIAAQLALDAQARSAAVSAISGIGLAPGATNLLAATVTRRLPGAERIDLGLLLSANDDFGPAALDWTLSALGTPEPDDVAPFEDRIRVDFGPAGNRWAYTFGFPEQYFLPSSLGVAEVRGWFALAPAAVGRTAAISLRSATIRQFLTGRRARRRLVRLSEHLPRSRRGGIVAASATAHHGDRRCTATLSARSESETTAACAAAIIAAWDRASPGVHLPEDAVDPESTLTSLTSHDIDVRVR